MSGTTRIQRKRRRGWKMPAGAVYVGRPSRWGNPYWVTRSSDFHGLAGSWFVLAPDGTKHHPEVDSQASARATAVGLYAADLDAGRARVTEGEVRVELHGADLVCWCPLDEPCHADVLLQIAADTTSDTTDTTDPADTAGAGTDAGSGPRPVTRVRRPSGRRGPRDLESPR